MQRREVTLDNALEFVIIDVGKGHEVSLQKRETIIVISQVQRLAHALGKHAHEAETTGIAAGHDTIEDAVIEGDAPVLPQLALEQRSLSVIKRHLDIEAIGLPTPLDEVA